MFKSQQNLNINSNEPLKSRTLKVCWSKGNGAKDKGVKGIKGKSFLKLLSELQGARDFFVPIMFKKHRGPKRF